jgi:hypothetical protein
MILGALSAVYAYIWMADTSSKAIAKEPIIV